MNSLVPIFPEVKPVVEEALAVDLVLSDPGIDVCLHFRRGEVKSFEKELILLIRESLGASFGNELTAVTS